ncbi:MAG: helix-turn-helix domain-containing protein [Cytophagales bacterium]|nr:helix-turn-helix domain-containing protein [Cytophagales bacterium]
MNFLDDTSVLENLKVYSPHKLDFYLIRIIKKGSGVLYKNHIPYQFKERSIIISSPNDILYVNYDKALKIEIYLIAFSESFIKYLNIDREMLGFANKLVSQSVVELDQENFSYLIRITELLKEENDKNPGGVKDRMPAKLVETLLYFLLRDFKETKLQTVASRNYINIYKDFLNLLSTHINSLHFVADYVDLMNINEKTLNRVCNKVTGFGALQIIHKQLDEEIKRLLFYSTLSNKEISQKLGFNDTTHLYKFFKKMNNMTPKQFKTKAQKVW